MDCFDLVKNATDSRVVGKLNAYIQMSAELNLDLLTQCIVIFGTCARHLQ